MTPNRLSNRNIRRLSGFGFQSFAQEDAYVVQPENRDALAQWLHFARQTGRHVVLRGQGRSYGNASLYPESIAIDLSHWNTLAIDAETGLATAGAGCTVEDLWRKGLPMGLWPPIVTGTMKPSLGGALAMNIHGKNAYQVGTIGEHVTEIEVMLVDGTCRSLTPTDPEFFAVISGAGQFGVIVSVQLNMKHVESGYLDVEPVDCPRWEDHFGAFEASIGNSDYAVSWVDAFPGGANKRGRGTFHRATYRTGGDGLSASDQDLPSKIMGLVPKDQVWRVLKLFNTRSRMRLLNASRYRSGSREARHGQMIKSLVGFSFLLDYVPGWQNAYAPHGFIQYQSFVPKDHAERVFAEQMDLMRQCESESFLAVLKRHRRDDFWISHGVDGYSLALDIKITPSTWPQVQAMCWQMNEKVLEADGKFYLAKDSTLRPQDVRGWLGDERIQQLRSLKRAWDPEHVLTSSQMERIQLFTP